MTLERRPSISVASRRIFPLLECNEIDGPGDRPPNPAHGRREGD
jgi:hypothetical protein